jgi:hypothetical protein
MPVMNAKARTRTRKIFFISASLFGYEDAGIGEARP